MYMIIYVCEYKLKNGMCVYVRQREGEREWGGDWEIKENVFMSPARPQQLTFTAHLFVPANLYNTFFLKLFFPVYLLAQIPDMAFQLNIMKT